MCIKLHLLLHVLGSTIESVHCEIQKELSESAGSIVL